MDDLIGQVIKNSYRVDSFLGSGGGAIIYRGTDVLLETPVAIKRLRPTVSELEQALVERFLREARNQAKLVHQNIVSIRALVEEKGEHFIVMEYVDGQDLCHLLSRYPQQQMDYSQIQAIFPQILNGLGHAHEHGVVHRDVKPSNILFSHDGQVKIADFGIARSKGDQKLTLTGALVGTAYYMAPELIREEPFDHRCDIYSTGITLYEVIAGRPPFLGAESGSKGGYELLYQHIYNPPPPLSQYRPDVPPALEAVVLQSIEKDPDARFPSCEAFSQALKQAMHGIDQTDQVPIMFAETMGEVAAASEILGHQGLPTNETPAKNVGMTLPLYASPAADVDGADTTEERARREDTAEGVVAGNVVDDAAFGATMAFAEAAAAEVLVQYDRHSASHVISDGSSTSRSSSPAETVAVSADEMALLLSHHGSRPAVVFEHQAVLDYPTERSEAPPRPKRKANRAIGLFLLFLGLLLFGVWGWLWFHPR